MLEPSHYEGREQTYVKHFFLENYLERVAYNIFSFEKDFVYVDGFSGPWKSATESYNDTSFRIAIDKLRNVRDGLLSDFGKTVQFRCLFVEKNPKPFTELEAAVAEITDVPIELIHGSFEDHILEIGAFARTNFSLIFIDPTGWQGFPMDKITPLLNLRGEVLINFMSDFINRFIEDSRPEIAASFDSLFGGDWYQDWLALTQKGLSREAAAIEVYTERLNNAGNFQYVTSTRILKPTSDRSYFYLIYATQHWKGIKEFRDVEKKAVEEQERVRNAAKYKAEVSRTNQENLFGSYHADEAANSYENERKSQLKIGYQRMLELLKNHSSGIKYENVLGSVLQTPLVWESDLKGWISDLNKNGQVSIPQMTGRERVPKIGYTIIPSNLSS